MLEISSKTNLLEKKSYKYSLQDVAEPNLQRDIYDYGTIPKVAFNHRRVPMGMPEEIWITDTSLRDGQPMWQIFEQNHIGKTGALMLPIYHVSILYSRISMGNVRYGVVGALRRRCFPTGKTTGKIISSPTQTYRIAPGAYFADGSKFSSS